MPLTADAQRAFRSVHVPRVPIELITAEHASWGAARFTSNTVPFVSRGNTYIPTPFIDVKPPPSQPGQIPAVEIALGINDQAFVAALRAANDSPVFTYEIVFADTPDVVQYETRKLTLEEAEMGVMRLRFFAGAFRIFQVLSPKLAYTPDIAPGVFV